MATSVEEVAMNIRYRVELSEVERGELRAMLSGGKHAARKLKRAQILLAADAGLTDETIAISLDVAGSTVSRIKRRFVEGGLERALNEEPRPGATRKLTGKEEALLVATACASPPAGRARWTLELLAGERWCGSPSIRASRARRCVAAWPRTRSSPGARRCGASRGSAASSSPGWRTCSTSMPKHLIRSAPWCASTRAQPSSSARRGGRSHPNRARSSASTTSTGVPER